MSKNRWRNVLVVLALVIAVALTIQTAFAKADLSSQAEARKEAKSTECASSPSRYSLHTEIMPETGTRLTYTEDGPTGMDGGLIQLFSDYRTCSR